MRLFLSPIYFVLLFISLSGVLLSADDVPGTTYSPDTETLSLSDSFFGGEPEEENFSPPPEFALPEPQNNPSAAPLVPPLKSEEIPLEEDPVEIVKFDMYLLNSEPYQIYGIAESMYSYLPGNGENFGWIDLQSTPYLTRGSNSGVIGMINLHLLAGPESTPIPPRLWDFLIGYQHRGEFSDRLSYDLATSIGVFSDFEDSARDGIRFPSHAVGMYHFNPDLDFVFGADYIDRDDLPLLPVVGFSIHRQNQPNIRYDLVFPRPRIDFVLDCQHRMYLAAFLNGGSWDIERPDESNDVMTYRDYRAVLGFEHTDGSDGLSAIELGYVFERQLLFRSIHTVSDFDDAFVLRLIWRR